MHNNIMVKGQRRLIDNIMLIDIGHAVTNDLPLQ